ncbi:MAG: hypothetical protein U1E39_08050 [Planctomycetota bacterium]
MSHRLLPTLLAIAVAVLFGAVPLRECHAAEGGGVVLAGAHAHDGGCCAPSAPEADACPCGHRHAPETPPGRDGHAPCCVDAAASIFAAVAEVALPPAGFAGVVTVPADLALATDAARVERAGRDGHGPAPGDGPPDGVVAVVLLR